MFDNGQTISIKIAIEIPVGVAESAIQKLQEFAANLSQFPEQIEAPKSPLLNMDEYGEALKYVGEKAKAEFEAKKQQELKKEENKKLRQKQLTDARLLYDLNVVQAYRLYRRILPDCDRDYTAYKTVGLHFDWPVSVVQSAVASRKRLIKAYLKSRQQKTVMHLIFLGWTNKHIAAHVGVHEKTIAKTFRQHRKEFRV